MPRYALILIAAALAALAVACSSQAGVGRGTLPSEMANDPVPDADFVGYLYFQPPAPVNVDIRRFLPSGGKDALKPAAGIDVLETAAAETALISGATILVHTGQDFAGTLEFVNSEDAENIYGLYGEYHGEDPLWARLDAESNRLDVVRGGSEWAKDVRARMEAGLVIPISQKNPDEWALLTNLPVSENDPPLAAGLISPNDDLIQEIERSVGVELSSLDTAFGNIGVHKLAFAFYGDALTAIDDEIDLQFLNTHDVGIVMVSQTDYPGFALSFILSAVGNRLGMEVFKLGDDNVRYRNVEDVHLLIKNKGGLIYATLSGARPHAEELMLRALAD